jgi:hypothetical protein
MRDGISSIEFHSRFQMRLRFLGLDRSGQNQTNQGVGMSLLRCLIVYDGSGYYLIHRRLSSGRLAFWPKTLLQQKEPGIRKKQSPLWQLGEAFKTVFAIDVSRCPRCKRDLEIIAAVLDPIQIARYLKPRGMPAAPPARA